MKIVKTFYSSDIIRQLLFDSEETQKEFDTELTRIINDETTLLEFLDMNTLTSTISLREIKKNIILGHCDFPSPSMNKLVELNSKVVEFDSPDDDKLGNYIYTKTFLGLFLFAKASELKYNIDPIYI